MASHNNGRKRLSKCSNLGPACTPCVFLCDLHSPTHCGQAQESPPPFSSPGADLGHLPKLHLPESINLCLVLVSVAAPNTLPRTSSLPFTFVPFWCFPPLNAVHQAPHQCRFCPVAPQATPAHGSEKQNSGASVTRRRRGKRIAFIVDLLPEHLTVKIDVCGTFLYLARRNRVLECLSLLFRCMPSANGRDRSFLKRVAPSQLTKRDCITATGVQRQIHQW